VGCCYAAGATISRWCFLFGPAAGQRHNNGVAFSLGSVTRTRWWANVVFSFRSVPRPQMGLDTKTD
jgi:hypothetical protein